MVRVGVLPVLKPNIVCILVSNVTRLYRHFDLWNTGLVTVFSPFTRPPKYFEPTHHQSCMSVCLTMAVAPMGL